MVGERLALQVYSVAGGEGNLAALLPNARKFDAPGTAGAPEQLLKTEHEVGGYTFNYVISPFLEDGSIIVSGSDVSAASCNTLQPGP